MTTQITQPSRSVSARFSAAAQTYHHESNLQRTVAENLASWMLPLDDIETVLEIGCGTGFLTDLLQAGFPRAVIHALDIAGAMVDFARERIGESVRMRWHVADAREFQTGEQFSLIISSSALHWMTPIQDTVKRLADMLAPGGSLVSALMVAGTCEELHGARKHLFPNKTAPVCMPPAEEIVKAVTSAGLTVEGSRQEVLRERYDSACGFFSTLNRQGVTGVATAGCSLLNRSELRRLIEYYDRKFTLPAGGVYASYRILYVKARKEDGFAQ